MEQTGHNVLRFDRFTLDLTRGSLRGLDQDIDLRPKAFEVLRYLVENSGRLVPKQELIEAVWPNVFVSDDSLVQCIRELRDKLGDSERRLIKTLPRRGYLLDAVVATPGVAVESTEPEPGLPEGAPTIALREGRLTLARSALSIAAVLLCVGVVSAYLVGRSPALVGVPTHPAPQRASFKDCETCPEMVALPAGAFMMGSPKIEQGHASTEGAPHRVVIAKPFAIGRFEVTVEQFSGFTAQSGAPVGDHCRRLVSFETNPVVFGPPDASFSKPGYDVTESHPASCINWHDAQAYVAWLRRRTGKQYRLPTEAEWEYAARAGTTTRFSFGDDDTQLCAYARFADLASPFAWRDGCRSETTTYGPLPVGQLKPNPWGLFDMHGNVWEWVADCWTADAREIPADGSAWTRPGHCEMGVVRGGSWAASSQRVRSAFRLGILTERRDQNLGFRVALPLNK